MIAEAADPSELRPHAPIWILGLHLAIALHVTLVVIVLVWLIPAEPDDDPGATAIDISLETAAPRIEQPDLPAGRPSDAAAAAPSVPDRSEPKKADVPKEVPDESPDPDRQVSPEADKPPKPEDHPTPKPVEAAPSRPSEASEATAPRKLETPNEAKRSSAPTLGTGVAARRAIATWQRQLVTHLDRHKRYPARAPLRSAEPVLGFRIDRRGRVISARIVRSSGDPAFDAAALEMMHRADPVPPPPVGMPDESLEFTMPVTFRVRRR